MYEEIENKIQIAPSFTIITQIEQLCFKYYQHQVNNVKTWLLSQNISSPREPLTLMKPMTKLLLPSRKLSFHLLVFFRSLFFLIFVKMHLHDINLCSHSKKHMQGRKKLVLFQYVFCMPWHTIHSYFQIVDQQIGNFFFCLFLIDFMQSSLRNNIHWVLQKKKMYEHP